MKDCIVPDWPAPAHVHALVTTRAGGVSRGPYAAMNLALHVGDDAAAVAENRRRLRLRLPAEPRWLEQVHGKLAVDAASAQPGCRADASVAGAREVVCAVLTADCLPVLLCDEAGSAVAAAHAGWRGLAAGVLESTLAALREGAGVPPSQVDAWIGPCIGPRRFEVGPDVLAALGEHAPSGTRSAFLSRPRPDGSPRWLADLPALARARLQAAGARSIAGGAWCTVDDGSRFFSYRRDGVTGRMAAAVWRR